mgnify:CR=1 FL=1
MVSKGIILDGNIKVGEYSRHEAEDSYGRRLLFDLKLNNAYLDVGLGKSKPLRFMFVDQLDQDGKYRLIDDIGMGELVGNSFFLGVNCITYKEAYFFKLPKNLNLN